MLSLEIEKCTGCRRCEVACAFSHFDAVDRNSARIKVVKLEGIGIDAPVFCVSCREKYCVEGCPEDALSVGQLGTVELKEEACTNCEVCVVCCPIGAVSFVDGFPLFCSLCEGSEKQSCVTACNVGALSAAALPQTLSLKSFERNRKGRNDEAKRVRYASSVSQPLRNKWSKKCSDTPENS